jgi:hypothetical protein
MEMHARAVNCAIERDRHNTKILDELLVDLNGAKSFSKLDLRDGYHQIEIDEDSRYAAFISYTIRFKTLQAVNTRDKIVSRTIPSCFRSLIGKIKRC